MTAAAVPWQRRLNVRLPVLLAAALIGFDILGGRINDLVFRAFGLPGSSGTIVLPGSDEILPFGAPASGVVVPLAEQLLAGAVRESAGRWRPNRAAIERAAALISPPCRGFLWAATDLEILAASPEFEHRVGTPWNPRLQPPDVSDHEHAEPMYGDGELRGWLVLQVRVPLPGHVLGGSPGAEPLVVSDSEFDPAEFNQAFRHIEIAARTVSVVVNLVTAILLGALVSRLVTVRLGRLTKLAADPLAADESQTEAIHEGGDEIAILGRALHGARGRVRELIAALEERDRERRQWIAQVAHDLRTPLTALLACIERAESQLHDPESARGALAVARLDAERVCELAEDLLEAARLETDGALALEPVLVGELVDRVTTGLAPLAAARGIQLEVRVPADLAPFSADGRRMLRALENLVRNAVRHAEGRVVVQVGRESGGLFIAVLDDGPGFAAGAEKHDADSTGLGLVIARRVARAHRGELTLENRPEGGARACMRLPLGRTSCPDPEDR